MEFALWRHYRVLKMESIRLSEKHTENLWRRWGVRCMITVQYAWERICPCWKNIPYLKMRWQNESIIWLSGIWSVFVRKYQIHLWIDSI